MFGYATELRGITQGMVKIIIIYKLILQWSILNNIIF